VPFAVKKELNCDNLFENYGSETGFGLVSNTTFYLTTLFRADFPVHIFVEIKAHIPDIEIFQGIILIANQNKNCNYSSGSQPVQIRTGNAACQGGLLNTFSLGQ
jgi:hypothetical protein